MRARVVVWMMVAILVAGCGARVGPGQQIAGGEGDRSLVSATSTDVSTAVPGLEPDGPAVAAAGESEGPSVEEVIADLHDNPKFSSNGRNHNDYVKIELSQKCYEPGQVFRATFVTEPLAGVSMVLSYPEARGGMAYGTADLTGRWVWQAPVPLDAGEGVGLMLGTSSSSKSSDRGGSADAPFEVADMGDCP